MAYVVNNPRIAELREQQVAAAKAGNEKLDVQLQGQIDAILEETVQELKAKNDVLLTKHDDTKAEAEQQKTPKGKLYKQMIAGYREACDLVMMWRKLKQDFRESKKGA